MRDLCVSYGLVINFKNFNICACLWLVFIDADNHLAAAINMGLARCCHFFNFRLWEARLHRFGHATHLFDLFNQGIGFFNQLIGQALHIIRASKRVNGICDACFMLQDKLSVTGNACRSRGRQGNGFIKRICVKRLCAAKRGGERFDGCADDVIIGILFLQRGA